jgi:hypothetical protein
VSSITTGQNGSNKCTQAQPDWETNPIELEWANASIVRISWRHCVAASDNPPGNAVDNQIISAFSGAAKTTLSPVVARQELYRSNGSLLGTVAIVTGHHETNTLSISLKPTNLGGLTQHEALLSGERLFRRHLLSLRSVVQTNSLINEAVLAQGVQTSLNFKGYSSQGSFQVGLVLEISDRSNTPLLAKNAQDVTVHGLGFSSNDAAHYNFTLVDSATPPHTIGSGENSFSSIEISSNARAILRGADLRSFTGKVWAWLGFQSMPVVRGVVGSIVAINITDTSQGLLPRADMRLTLEGEGFAETSSDNYSVTLEGTGCRNSRRTYPICIHKTLQKCYQFSSGGWTSVGLNTNPPSSGNCPSGWTLMPINLGAEASSSENSCMVAGGIYHGVTRLSASRLRVRALLLDCTGQVRASLKYTQDGVDYLIPQVGIGAIVKVKESHDSFALQSIEGETAIVKGQGFGSGSMQDYEITLWGSSCSQSNTMISQGTSPNPAVCNNCLDDNSDCSNCNDVVGRGRRTLVGMTNLRPVSVSCTSWDSCTISSIANLSGCGSSGDSNGIVWGFLRYFVRQNDVHDSESCTSLDGTTDVYSWHPTRCTKKSKLLSAVSRGEDIFRVTGVTVSSSVSAGASATIDVNGALGHLPHFRPGDSVLSPSKKVVGRSLVSKPRQNYFT